MTRQIDWGEKQDDMVQNEIDEELYLRSFKLKNKKSVGDGLKTNEPQNKSRFSKEGIKVKRMRKREI